MLLYYELLEDGTIGQSTPNEKIAKSLGLTLTTDKEIIYSYDGRRYFKDNVPSKPTELVINEKREIRNQYLIDTDKYMIADYPISDELREQYKQYRKYLRDLPLNGDFANIDIMLFEEWVNK